MLLMQQIFTRTRGFDSIGVVCERRSN